MKSTIITIITIFAAIIILIGCTQTPQLAKIPTALPSETPSPTNTTGPEDTPTPATLPTAADTETPLPTDIPLPTPTFNPANWRDMPVIPETISDTTRAIYKMGQLMGNDPHAFSKVGDCNSTLPYFLADFDNPKVYDLGPYADLQDTITYFQGSFERESLATKIGLSSGAALAVLWADWKSCNSSETPLDCEYRVQNPSFAIISIGTNDVTDKTAAIYFEDKMRRVLDHTIGKGIIPIIATKADNAEGNHYINETLVKLAVEYQLPLWNYWRAVQPLPNHGLQEDKVEHLTMPGDLPLLCNFEDPENLKNAFTLRNLTALQVLDVVRRGVTEE